jgi:hypothetical protein
MNRRGEWLKTSSGDPDNMGFHLPSMASPFTSWESLAVLWLQAMDDLHKGDDRAQAHFQRHQLALPFIKKGLRISEKEISDRCTNDERLTLPEDFSSWVIGVDVHADSIFWVAMALNRKIPAVHIAGFGMQEGNPELLIPTVARLVLTDSRGRGIGCRYLLADAADGKICDLVYRACRRAGAGAYPFHGVDTFAKSDRYWTLAKGGDQEAHGGRLVLLNKYALRDLQKGFLDRMQFSFYKGTDQEPKFCHQFQAYERRTKRSPSGAVKSVWTQRPGYSDDHFADAGIAAFAGCIIAGLLNSPLADNLELEPSQPSAPKPAQKKQGVSINRIEYA